MPRYIEENDIYKLVTPTGTAKIHCSQIDELPRADVVPRSEVEKAKQEVAREIVEKIENFISSEKGTIISSDKLEQLIYNTGVDNAKFVLKEEIVEEFKKKYIGEKK